MWMWRKFWDMNFSERNYKFYLNRAQVNGIPESDLEFVKILFQNQMKTETKAVAFSWLLNFEPYFYWEDQLKKELL